ncbi:MAG TPA: hypothetical protein VGV61_12200 [Thermoanaerobaculia bacterium]|nr:hypothetical protein [Thermoanaerobaculia bacterium]
MNAYPIVVDDTGGARYARCIGNQVMSRRRGLRRGLVGLLLLAALAGRPAAAVESWRTVPLWGGDVVSLAFAPADPDLVLAGTAAGQVFLSRDGGASWQPAGAVFPLAGWIVASLQFDPNRPSRVWAALRGVFGGGALVRSDDLGRSWETRTQRPGDEIFALALVPGEEGRLLIGTRTGVWGSSDAGTSWRQLSGSQPDLVEVSSLLVHPQHPQTVIAGTFRRAFRSTDGGATWRGVFDGMVLDTQIFSLAAVPNNDSEVWAATCGWVYRSDDGGERWARFKDGLTERRAPGFQALPGGRLLAGTVSGVYSSDDRGATWARRTRDDLSVATVAYHPKRPAVVLVGTEGSGVWRSTDGGATFLPASHGITAPRVTALARGRNELLAAVAHGGPAAGIYAVLARGSRVVHQTTQMPTVLSLAVAGRDAWAATEGGLFARRDGIWTRVGELPAARFEQVVAADGRVVARSRDGLFERAGERFAPITAPAPAWSAAVHGGEVMVAGAAGAWQLAAEGPRSLTLPAVGQLGSSGGRLFLSGADGLWTRGRGDGAWLSHIKGRARVLATGDASFPAVVVSEDGAQLFATADRGLHLLALPIPARDVLAAAVDGGQLFLGTSGYGLLHADLDELVPPVAGGGATVAAGPH